MTCEKIELIADIDGLLKIDRQKLPAVNALGKMMIASRHGDFPVKKGDKIAGMRVIPLVIEKEKMARAHAAAAGGPIFRILPFRPKKVGIVTTGNEVFYGRIQDAFTPAIVEKVQAFGAEIIGHEISNDDHERITGCIRRLLDAGAELILCTGCMSVDPDDRTPLAIRNSDARIVSYGSPVLPGAMFLVSYWGEKNIPILGVPGCAMYSRRTVLDLILPHAFADDLLEKADLDQLGEGGLCLNCRECIFPHCGFGK